MKKAVRFLALLFAVLMLAVSCDADTPDIGADTTPAETTPTEVIPENAVLSADLSKYIVIRSADASTTVQAAAVKLKGILSSRWGETVKFFNDGDVPKPTEYEILVGDTNRPETAAFAKTLGGTHYGDWLAHDSGEDSYEGATSADLIASAFFYHSADLLVRAGKVLGKDMSEYFGLETLKMIVTQPFGVTKTEGRFDVICTVKGGGVSGQAGAIRHGISRALVTLNPEFRPALKAAGFMTRDPRMKERKKYGLKGARRAPQFSKR